jgi:hypothetical protein
MELLRKGKLRLGEVKEEHDTTAGRPCVYLGIAIGELSPDSRVVWPEFA